MKDKFSRPFLLCLIFLITLSGCKSSFVDKNKITLTISDKSFLLTIAKTQQTKTLGLSNIKGLSDNEGMVFIYDKSENLSFWMKETYIPLDIIFLDNCKVVDFQSMTVEKDPSDPKQKYTSKYKSNMAIEINSGILNKSIVGTTVEKCNQLF